MLLDENCNLRLRDIVMAIFGHFVVSNMGKTPNHRGYGFLTQICEPDLDQKVTREQPCMTATNPRRTVFIALRCSLARFNLLISFTNQS